MINDTFELLLSLPNSLELLESFTVLRILGPVLIDDFKIAALQLLELCSLSADDTEKFVLEIGEMLHLVITEVLQRIAS